MDCLQEEAFHTCDIFAGKGGGEFHPTTDNAHGMAVIDGLWSVSQWEISLFSPTSSISIRSTGRAVIRKDTQLVSGSLTVGLLDFSGSNDCNGVTIRKKDGDLHG